MLNKNLSEGRRSILSSGLALTGCLLIAGVSSLHAQASSETAPGSSPDAL